MSYFGLSFLLFSFVLTYRATENPARLLLSNRLMGMCPWIGSHFHEWIDYNGVAFSTEDLEWGRIFSGFWGKNILASSKFGY